LVQYLHTWAGYMRALTGGQMTRDWVLGYFRYLVTWYNVFLGFSGTGVDFIGTTGYLTKMRPRPTPHRVQSKGCLVRTASAICVWMGKAGVSRRRHWRAWCVLPFSACAGGEFFSTLGTGLRGPDSRVDKSTKATEAYGNKGYA
jgi:hypothetical protein